MKIEKIEKHMRKRTVLVGENAGNPATVGIVTAIDRDDNTAQVVGYVLPDSHDRNWYGFDLIRKATVEECAAFFAWLRSNGRDVASGFERFGGAPRWWEEAEQGVQSYKVGDRVRLREGTEWRIAPTYFAPGAEVVIVDVSEGSSGFSYEARGPIEGGSVRSQGGLHHADIAGLVEGPPRTLDASASMDQRRAVVGKRVRVVRSLSGMNDGRIGVVAEVDGSSTPYRVEHAGGNAWAKEIENLSDEAAPLKPEEKKAEQVEEIKAGDWVYILSTDFRGAGQIPSEVRVGEVRRCLGVGESGVYLPISVERFPGATNEFGSRWHFARSAVRLATAEEIAAEEARRAPAPKRPTVGDSVIGVRRNTDRLKNGLAHIARIETDDHDHAPYRLAGGDAFFRADHTFPLTLDGFRAANAKQREYGVTYEEGDYAALIGSDGVLRIGAIFPRADGTVCLSFNLTAAAIKGDEDWSDRVVVLTKRPKV